MNEDYYHEQNSCYDSNSFGFDQVQPPQYTVNHPIFNFQNELLNSQNEFLNSRNELLNSAQVIKSSVEDLVLIPSESEGIPDKMCDVPLCENTTPLNALNEHSEIVVNSDDDNSSSDDDSPYGEDIDYVDASPPDVEIVNLGGGEIVTGDRCIKRYPLHFQSCDTVLLLSFLLFLEETNTFDNSIPESETFRFNLEEISSGSPTTRSDLSLPDYKAFYVDNDHFKEKSSGSTTTHGVDLYHEEFADELTHIMSLPNLECFKFKIEPDPGDLTSIDPGIRKNVSTTNVNVPLEDDQSSLFAYVVWIFLAFLTYPVVPPYLLSTGNEDTIFDPGILIYHSFMPDVSHRSGTFIKFNVYPNRLNESPMMILPSTCFPMDQ
ncbi:hypothetical protein Tco_0319832 [Tanacetum coccineum]